MFCLSPKEDLILLAVKYNNPDYNWDQISEQIFTSHNEFIPSEICSQRYQSFLKRVAVNQDINSFLPFKIRSPPIISKKIPENFIFEYKQLLNNANATEDSLTLNSLERYEKRLLEEMLFGDKQSKTKLISKQKKTSKNGQSQKKNKVKLLNKIYINIKERMITKGILTQSIIQQKLQQLLFSIFEKINDKISSYSNKYLLIEPFQNTMKLIKLFSKHNLIRERMDILQFYDQDEDISFETALRIKQKADYVLNVFSYEDVITGYQINNYDDYSISYDAQQYNQQVSFQKDKIAEYSQDNLQVNLFQQPHSIELISHLYKDDEKQPKGQAQSVKKLEQDISKKQEFLSTLDKYLNLHPEKPKAQCPLPQYSFLSMQVTISNQQATVINYQPPQKQQTEEVKIQVKFEPKPQFDTKIQEVKEEVHEEQVREGVVRRIKKYVKRPKPVYSGKIVIEIND